MAAGVLGAAGAVLVGHDGSPGWQLLRVAAVVAVTAGTVWALARLEGRQRALVAYLAGLVGVAVGLGIGPAHLAKGGSVLLTVAGLLCLGAGLLLLVAGTVVLVRSVHGWRRPLVALATFVVAFLLVFPTSPAVYATNVPRPGLGSATPADAGLAFREVHFRTPDGVRLSGWYIPSRAGAAVVLLHGAGSTRSAVLAQAVVLARHGYGVLLFDARGHGRSAGRAMDFGWYGDQDIAGAISYLTRQPDVERSRIGAVGLSMGGEEAIGAAATDKRIRAVVAEGATGRDAADLAWLPDTYGVRGSVTEAWEGLLTYGVADLLTSARPPISLHDAVARAAPVSVLLIAAGDVAEEPSAARYIRSASPRTVQVWQVPHTGHTRGLATHPRAWETHVVGFLDRALSATS